MRPARICSASSSGWMLATWWVWATFSARVIWAMSRSTRSSTGSEASSQGRSVDVVMSVGLQGELEGGGAGRVGRRRAGRAGRACGRSGVGCRDEVGERDGHASASVRVGELAGVDLATGDGDAADAVALLARGERQADVVPGERDRRDEL